MQNAIKKKRVIGMALFIHHLKTNTGLYTWNTGVDAKGERNRDVGRTSVLTSSDRRWLPLLSDWTTVNLLEESSLQEHYSIRKNTFQTKIQEKETHYATMDIKSHLEMNGDPASRKKQE